MSRLSLLVVVSSIVAVLLTACGGPTATPTPTAGAAQPTNAVVAPTEGLPTGYPARPSATPLPQGYPNDQPAVPTSTQSSEGYPAAEATATEAPPTETATPTVTPTTGPVLITYRNYEIVPAETTIPAGTMVTFVIEGDKHQPYAGSAAPWIFEAPPDLQNTTWSITFNNAQTLTILCGYHPNMTATLIVE